ncbi:hypothetical protein [uncultured Bacteroides sp.]|uniref:hypothetical protein n=1 Tax=uncultured Bacteroides sp. TaxID=162156 RepID=UPI002AABC5C0|nr:hypothetical protein [uncultured Bacteroides sp.]
MYKVEEIIGLLIELSDSELDVIRQKIDEIKRSRNNAGNTFKVKDNHRDMMLKFNPFLEGKI